MSEIQVKILLAVAAGLWWMVLALQGEPVTLKLLMPFSTVVSGVAIVLLVFDKLLWKWRWLHPWLVPFPNLNGTWRGALQSDWVDPQTTGPREPIEAFLVIRQSYSRLSVRLLTAESESELITGKILHADDDTDDLLGVYRNTPRQSVRDRSPIHHGAVALRVTGADMLAGSYWTDRNTRGELQFRRRKKKHAPSFDAARKL